MLQNVLEIRKDIFGEKNLCVAMVHEDLGYASYVQEYSSGEFENARYETIYSALFFAFLVSCDVITCHWAHKAHQNGGNCNHGFQRSIGNQLIVSDVWKSCQNR